LGEQSKLWLQIAAAEARQDERRKKATQPSGELPAGDAETPG